MHLDHNTQHILDCISDFCPVFVLFLSGSYPGFVLFLSGFRPVYQAEKIGKTGEKIAENHHEDRTTSRKIKCRIGYRRYLYYTLTMIETTPAKRSDGLLTVELGPSVKAQWVQWCKERDLLPGKAIKRLVDRAMAEGLELATSADGAKVKVKVLTGADTGAQIGKEIYFRPTEAQAIQAVADAQGFGFHEWVIAAVRAALANAPSYGQAELEALTRSNLQLVQVVAELTALRKGGTLPEHAHQLQALESSIRSHVEQVSKAMAQGARRWQLKV